jgi:6-phospho-beta-glucosidase
MKLAVLGGAGVRAVFLARGVAARAAETGIDSLALYDIDAARLSLIAPLCARAAELAGAGLEVRAFAEADEALDGADAVISTFRVGGDRSRVDDERLARKYRLLPQETTGIGGFLMALRTVPVLLEYCRALRAAGSKAAVFNFANPSGLVTQALRAAGFDEVVGICDTPSSTSLRVCAALGAQAGEIEFRWAGLNHLSWVFRALRGGADILPGLLADEAFLGKVPELAMFDPALVRRLGCLPNEYLYYYYYRDRALANALAEGATRGEFIEANNAALFAALARPEVSGDPDRGLAVHAAFMRRREASYMARETGRKAEPEVHGGGAPGAAQAAEDGIGYAKVVLDLLAARRSGRESEAVLSVPHAGALPFLEPGDVAEISCAVGPAGPAPLDPGPVPEHAALLMAQVKRFERLAAQSALEARPALARAAAEEALMAHPLIASYPLAKALAEEAFP